MRVTLHTSAYFHCQRVCRGTGGGVWFHARTAAKGKTEHQLMHLEAAQSQSSHRQKPGSPTPPRCGLARCTLHARVVWPPLMPNGHPVRKPGADELLRMRACCPQSRARVNPYPRQPLSGLRQRDLHDIVERHGQRWPRTPTPCESVCRTNSAGLPTGALLCLSRPYTRSPQPHGLFLGTCAAKGLMSKLAQLYVWTLCVRRRQPTRTRRWAP